MERILTQIMNMVMRKLMNWGVNAGINHLSGGGKAPKDMTPEERAQAAKGRDLAQKARQMAKLGRRLGR
jgi:hypothetical protein